MFPLVAALSASEQRPRRRGNRAPSIESFSSSKRVISVCQFHPELFDKSVVDLLVTASDPDGDRLQYEYSTNDGTISGKGKWVTWDLKDAMRGPHEVRVTVTDGKGGRVEAALTVTTVDSGTCDPPTPPCPTIKVSCPEEMDKSKPFIFSVVVEGEEKSYEPPSFRWKLNAGRIVKGQFGREIEVTTTGANGFDNITATIEIRGFDPSCTYPESCTTKIIW